MHIPVKLKTVPVITPIKNNNILLLPSYLFLYPGQSETMTRILFLLVPCGAANCDLHKQHF